MEPCIDEKTKSFSPKKKQVNEEKQFEQPTNLELWRCQHTVGEPYGKRPSTLQYLM